MASFGGHALPGFLFFFFGIYQAIRISLRNFKKTSNKSSTPSSCCRSTACNMTLVEGFLKIFCVTIGMLIELFYPGSPVGKLYDNDGQFYKPMNWQHSTMYLFFGMYGVADVASVLGQGIVPEGIERFFGGIALYVEGLLFFFHLNGRSIIDTRVHTLVVMTAWPGAFVFFLQLFMLNRRGLLTLLELIQSTLFIAQGFWFLQVAHMLYPLSGPQQSWDPCIRNGGDDDDDMASMMMPAGAASSLGIDSGGGSHCNDAEAMLNNMFITMFYCWYFAAALTIVSFIYLVTYKCVKSRGLLSDGQTTLQYHAMTNGKLHVPDQRTNLLSEEDEF